jgi:Leucine-rich repeat (LRR) protein
MQDLPRQELIDIVERVPSTEQNQPIEANVPEDWESQLRDRCGSGYRRELDALIEAHHMEIITELELIRANVLEEIKGRLLELTNNLMETPLDLKTGEAYWVIDSWARALGINVPQATTFTCTWNIKIKGHTDEAQGNWNLLGVTPGSVTIPPDFDIGLKPASMDAECFPIWVRHLCRVEEVKYLDLSGQDIDDQSLTLLDKFLSLEWLDLSSTEITDKGLLTIGELNGLRHLYLNDCRWITDKGLEHLCTLRTLEALELAGNPKISNEGLKHLTRIPHLMRLKLRETGIQSAALFALEGLQFLQELDVSYTEINDSAIAPLCALPRLEDLTLTGCSKITDVGIAHLQSVLSLHELKLSETRITDGALKYVRRLPNLQNVELERCWQITPQGVQVLRRPGLRIVLGGDHN